VDTLSFSRKEFAPLRELAEQLGITVEEAAIAAAKEGLELMFRLPTNQADVRPLQGLNSTRSDG
jgi:adenine/guanine phosphoribosyltransferase-like PRPP-binding protein